MFKPNQQAAYCPICGAPLEYDTIDQFDVPVGYSVQCNACCRYSDIWVNGLREVQCGDWCSPDYDSDFGAMTQKDKWRERGLLLCLNGHLLWERLQYKWTQRKAPAQDHTEATA